VRVRLPNSDGMTNGSTRGSVSWFSNHLSFLLRVVVGDEDQAEPRGGPGRGRQVGDAMGGGNDGPDRAQDEQDGSEDAETRGPRGMMVVHLPFSQSIAGFPSSLAHRLTP